MVKPGDEITVRVLRLDEDKQKISLGVKQLTADPWLRAGDTYAIGQVRRGRVTRLAEFGAFVELEPGIEAMAHVSTFAPGPSRDWRRSVAVGTTATFEIVSIDAAKRRIGVALVDEGSAPEEDVREHVEGRAAPERLGSLGDQLRNVLKR
jgi:ribosomal protein S1